ncbi:metallophosphoesterase [Methylobacterium sp. Leaf108]|uniref:metallophosphoesterase n=1 Tax=Methylobacterium sp. Leaf108 TaxID=1736256 RepID=UPI0006F88D13|nr:metallophosphoesterase [Methylobacterium sp. Leaf108]KQP61382.1 metallophosphoesterase [Methylobacterium sp. Leaf108]
MPDGAPVRITRRTLLAGLGSVALAGGGTAAYATGIEPFRLAVTRYRIKPLGPWPEGLSLRIVALADLHACEPWMSVARIRAIVETANGLGGDVIVLLGDYVSGMRLVTRYVDAAEWGPVLGGLRAPLGTHAILGNHDWWEDTSAQRRGAGPTIAGDALRAAGIRVLQNEALALRAGGHEVWLAGLGDQLAFLPSRRRGHPRLGVDDLGATLAQIPQDKPAILLAHEPDIFPEVPARVALTLSGHTHGGQIRMFGYAPVVPSRYRGRYAYGHVREQGDLVVSGGLGMSIAPVRFGIPPEIVVVDLSSQAPA